MRVSAHVGVERRAVSLFSRSLLSGVVETGVCRNLRALCLECRQNHPTDRFLMEILNKALESSDKSKIPKTKAANKMK